MTHLKAFIAGFATAHMRCWSATPSSSQSEGRRRRCHPALLPEGQHNFILGAGGVPEADRTIGEIGWSLRSKLGLAVLAAA